MIEECSITVPGVLKKDRRSLAVRWAMSKAGMLMEKWGVDSVRVTQLHPETIPVITDELGAKHEIYTFEIRGGDDAAQTREVP